MLIKLNELETIEAKIEEEINRETKDTNPINPYATVEDCKLAEAAEAAKEKRLKNQSLKQAIEFRRFLTKFLLGFIIIWMVYIGYIVWLEGITNGMRLGFKEFYLPENVMIALLGTTTATIVGLFVIVTKYFFNTK